MTVDASHIAATRTPQSTNKCAKVPNQMPIQKKNSNAYSIISILVFSLFKYKNFKEIMKFKCSLYLPIADIKK